MVFNIRLILNINDWLRTLILNKPWYLKFNLSTVIYSALKVSKNATNYTIIRL